MRGRKMRYMVTAVFVLLFGFLIVNRTMLHANAGEKNSPSCVQAAGNAKQDSLKKGFSEAGANSQAENFLSRCLIDGK